MVSLSGRVYVADDGVEAFSLSEMCVVRGLEINVCWRSRQCKSIPSNLASVQMNLCRPVKCHHMEIQWDY